MTSLDPSFSGDSSLWSRFLNWCAHMLLWTALLILATSVASIAGVNHWILKAATVVAGAAVCVAAVHNERQDLCVRCMREVPADAPARAQRQQWALRLWHVRTEQSWGTMAVYVVVLGVGVAVFVEAIPSVAFVVVPLILLVDLYIMWLHHRLRPWCPYCRDWDEGGEHEVAPDPVDEAIA